jgi:D-glycero-D-manno-heptose 1,7-bisphosphate phosphatase
VINKSLLLKDKPVAPKNASELDLLPDVIQAINLLRKANFELIVVTNQPDISRGIITYKNLDEIHNQIRNITNLDKFYICTHVDEDNCECRKPKPGLLLKAAAELNISIEGSYIVGDRWRDMEAGQALGISCYFVDYSYREKQPSPPFVRVTSLMEAAQLIVKEVKNL